MRIIGILSILLMLFGCNHSIDYKVYESKINIFETPEKRQILKGLAVIIEELDKEKIFLKSDMIKAINKNRLNINFTNGISYNGFKCIFVRYENFNDICLSGYFDGKKTITMIKNDKLHNSSFAHEMLHYFQRHINKLSGHNPEELWIKLVGFKTSGIGILNKALQREDL